MLELFQKGGVMMYPILALSVIALAIFLERLITLRKNKFVPANFEDQLKFLVKKRSTDEAKELCEKNKSSLAIVCLVIMKNMDLPLTRLLDVAEEVGSREAAKLYKYQQTLLTIVAIAPLLGLLGTVFGMIEIFDVLSLQGSGNAQELSAGIAVALITTAAGLLVAIPTQMFYHIVHARSESIARDLELSSSKIMNLLFKEDLE